MAKKAYDPNDFAAREAAIRKAKGNPNKNVHHKKNGSNYGGVSAAKKPAAKQGGAEKQPPLPRGIVIVQWTLVAVVVVVLILFYGVFPESLLMSYICALLMGGTCCFLAYVNRTYRQRKGTFYKVLSVILVVLGVVYAAMGLMGLVSYLGK